MANIPIIDTHVHLWNPDRFRMPWLDGDALLGKAYTPETFKEHRGNLPVEGIVFVECDVMSSYSYLEAAWVAMEAHKEPLIAGIVAAAPIEFGERARAYLESLVALGPRIKGVRRLLQDEKDPQYCLSEDFIRGTQLLANYHFSFDICIRHWQFPAIIELVRRCPGTAFILDHLGKPDIKARQLDPWREHLRALAALPNVYCKLSGLVTETDHAAWQYDDLVPYLSHALEVFGEDRVVFGGDWPVALQASDYVRWAETLQRFTENLPEAAQRKLWNENARRFYRL